MFIPVSRYSNLIDRNKEYLNIDNIYHIVDIINRSKNVYLIKIRYNPTSPVEEYYINEDAFKALTSYLSKSREF